MNCTRPDRPQPAASSSHKEAQEAQAMKLENRGTEGRRI